MKSSPEESASKSFQEIVRTPERNTSPGSSPRNRRYSSQARSTSSITSDNYDILSDEIIANLRDREFDTIIFDFDGTLTKSHTARATKSEIGTLSNWLADEMILERILRKGRENGIKFYIASNQRPEVIETILEQHNLLEYFTKIHGNTSGFPQKEIALDEIAQNPENQKILYLDDDPEIISSSKVTFIRGLLKTLDARENPKKRDINGEAGLTFEKWGQIKDCLQRDDYDLNTPRSQRRLSISDSTKFLTDLTSAENLSFCKSDILVDSSNGSQSSSDYAARNFEPLSLTSIGKTGR